MYHVPKAADRAYREAVERPAAPHTEVRPAAAEHRVALRTGAEAAVAGGPLGEWPQEALGPAVAPLLSAEPAVHLARRDPTVQVPL